MIEYTTTHDNRITNKYAHCIKTRVEEKDIIDKNILKWLAEQPYRLKDPINYHLLVIISRAEVRKTKVIIFDLNNLVEIRESFLRV